MRLILLIVMACFVHTKSLNAQYPAGGPNPTPDCAIRYLYSVGSLHYYETIACQNPSITGYGTTAGVTPINPLGCSGFNCLSPTDPAEMGKAGVDSTDRRRRFDKRKESFRSYRRRLNTFYMRTDVSSFRKDRADSFRKLLKPSSPFIADLRGDNGLARQRRAEYYKNSVEKLMNTASVRPTVENAAERLPLSVENKDWGIDFLPHRLDATDPVPTLKLFKQKKAEDDDMTPPTNITIVHDAGADEDRILADKAGTTRSYLAKVMVGGDPIMFRVQHVIINQGGGKKVHQWIGQQINESELPTNSPLPIEGADNVKWVDRHEHVHAVQLRINGNNMDMDAANSREFLIYSAENLSDDILP